MSNLPHILVYSEDAVTASHGTGTIFARNFSNYPREKLFNVCFRDLPDPLVSERLVLSRHLFQYGILRNAANLLIGNIGRITRRHLGKDFFPWLNAPAAGRAVRRNRPAVDVFYSICHNSRDFHLTRLIHDQLPDKTPLVVHLHDF
jgi:hypothetical protein